MARVTGNSLLRGISGKLGGLVVRQVGDQTIVSAAEGEKPGPGSPRQQAQRYRMYHAQCYANAQMQDPAAKALYSTGINGRLTSSRLLAITDFLRAPKITAVDLSAYHGRPRDLVRVLATDDFAVTAVLLRFFGGAGALLGEVAAVLQADGSWQAPAPAALATERALHLEVTAFDRPGNRTVQSCAL
ncbi:hypothetical protein LRS06_16110 [Hymenobacter sp. J193]|uniref:hypothetical protein n=1 Tax=Hymenobacter sp. J193 TaxID=2898429 RepID=UPI002150E272|nr:hypothetical protein [Hymenobacter sp. J193]MCR5889262.1 hypothetical protein [Hymenobacter sp. J193]